MNVAKFREKPSIKNTLSIEKNDFFRRSGGATQKAKPKRRTRPQKERNHAILFKKRNIIVNPTAFHIFSK